MDNTSFNLFYNHGNINLYHIEKTHNYEIIQVIIQFSALSQIIRRKATLNTIQWKSHDNDIRVMMNDCLYYRLILY